MATKTTTEKTTKAAAPKKAAAKKAPSKAAAAASARHPLARLKALHGNKETLVKAIVEPLATAADDTAELSKRLLKSSNQKLLHLANVVETVKKKYGNREKLVAAIGKTANRVKDKDYLTKLATLSLPRLLDLAQSSERRAKNA